MIKTKTYRSSTVTAISFTKNGVCNRAIFSTPCCDHTWFSFSVYLITGFNRPTTIVSTCIWILLIVKVSIFRHVSMCFIIDFKKRLLTLNISKTLIIHHVLSCLTKRVHLITIFFRRSSSTIFNGLLRFIPIFSSIYPCWSTTRVDLTNHFWFTKRLIQFV